MKPLSRHTLLDDWMLGREDVVVVCQARGQWNRLYAGAALCSLRATGAFVDWVDVPVEALHQLSQQLDRSPVVGNVEPIELRTAQNIRRRVRDYLRFRPFDAAAQEWLDQELGYR